MAEIGEILRRFEQLKSERSVWAQHWQQISDYVLPERGRFIGEQAGLQLGEAGGRRRHFRIFDDTAPWALEQLASGLQGMLTGPAVRWFQLKARRPASSFSMIGPVNEPCRLYCS